MDILTIEFLKPFFLWTTLINFGLLMFYFILFVSAKKFIYKLHSKWFKLTEKELSATLYKVLAFYKIATIAFNLVPYLALLIIG